VPNGTEHVVVRPRIAWTRSQLSIGFRALVALQKALRTAWALRHVLMDVPHRDLNMACAAPIPPMVPLGLATSDDVGRAEHGLLAPKSVQFEVAQNVVAKRPDGPIRIGHEYRLIAHIAKMVTRLVKSIRAVYVGIVEYAEGGNRLVGVEPKLHQALA
jgi:hypothetical protein